MAKEDYDTIQLAEQLIGLNRQCTSNSFNPTEYYVLLIGNTKYDKLRDDGHLKMKDVDTAPSNVKTIQEFLTSKYVGIPKERICVLLDATND